MTSDNQTEQLQLRVHGRASLPTLVYLPGLHGDWTLIGGFRQAICHHVRFVELTYPRTLTWSLDDYASAIEKALAQHGITGGWLLGESYGSQVLWTMVRRGKFTAQGVILAGGFVRHPLRWAMRLAEKLAGRISDALVVRLVFACSRFARFRHRHSPEILAAINAYAARRTGRDCRAAQHRLRLIVENDLRPVASHVPLPVYGLTGISDPIVPWPWVRRWLDRNCPALRDYKVIWSADHYVLCSEPRKATRQVLEWMTRTGTGTGHHRN